MSAAAASAPSALRRTSRRVCRPISRSLTPPSSTRRRRSQLFEQRWTAWGSAYRRQQQCQRRSGGRLQQCHGEHLRLCRRHGLSRSRRTRWWASRSPAPAPIGGLANALGTGRSDALQAGAYGISWFGPAYLAGALVVHQSLVHDQSHRARRSLDGELRRPELWRAARRRLPLRRAADVRRDAVWRRAVAGLPHAGLQRDRRDRRRLRALATTR